MIAAPDGQRVRQPDRVRALATAGSGDVLCGVIGALLAGGADPLDGRAGRRLRARRRRARRCRVDLGDGVAAGDLPLAIARSWSSWRGASCRLSPSACQPAATAAETPSTRATPVASVIAATTTPPPASVTQRPTSGAPSGARSRIALPAEPLPRRRPERRARSPASGPSGPRAAISSAERASGSPRAHQAAAARTCSGSDEDAIERCQPAPAVRRAGDRGAETRADGAGSASAKARASAATSPSESRAVARRSAAAEGARSAGGDERDARGRRRRCC